MLLLVVEDDALTALSLDLTLSLAGHSIIGPTATVNDAVRRIDRTPPDLALVDLDLKSDGDGVAVARYARQRYGKPSLFMSGNTARARDNRGSAIGLVQKPYDLRGIPAIVRCVEDILKGSEITRLPAGLEYFGLPH